MYIHPRNSCSIPHPRRKILRRLHHLHLVVCHVGLCVSWTHVLPRHAFDVLLAATAVYCCQMRSDVSRSSLALLRVLHELCQGF